MAVLIRKYTGNIPFLFTSVESLASFQEAEVSHTMTPPYIIALRGEHELCCYGCYLWLVAAEILLMWLVEFCNDFFALTYNCLLPSFQFLLLLVLPKQNFIQQR